MLSILVLLSHARAYPHNYCATGCTSCQATRVHGATVFPLMGPGGSTQVATVDATILSTSRRIVCDPGEQSLVWVDNESYATSNRPCLSYNDNRPIPQNVAAAAVCARSGQSTFRLWEQRLADYDIVVVGSGWAGTLAINMLTSKTRKRVNANVAWIKGRSDKLSLSHRSTGTMHFATRQVFDAGLNVSEEMAGDGSWRGALYPSFPSPSPTSAPTSNSPTSPTTASPSLTASPTLPTLSPTSASSSEHTGNDPSASTQSSATLESTLRTQWKDVMLTDDNIASVLKTIDTIVTPTKWRLKLDPAVPDYDANTTGHHYVWTNTDGQQFLNSVDILNDLAALASPDRAFENTTVTAWTANETVKTIVYSNASGSGYTLTTRAVIFATGGPPLHVAAEDRLADNDGIAETPTSALPTVTTSKPYAWHVERCIAPVSETCSPTFTSATIRWFTAASQQVVNATGTCYAAFTSYNTRTLCLHSAGLGQTNLTAYKLDTTAASSDTINGGVPSCAYDSSSRYWLTYKYYWSVPESAACTSDGIPVILSTNTTVRAAILDTKGTLLTHPNGSLYCTANGSTKCMLVYLTGNAAAWPFADSYIGPGSTIGNTALTASATTTALRSFFGTMAQSVAAVTANLNWFAIGVLLWAVGLGLIAVFPWVDRYFKTKSNKVPFLRCGVSNYFSPNVWSAVSAVHGALMISGFAVVVVGVVTVKGNDVPRQGDATAHKTTGYWTLLVWCLQLVFGVALWFLIRFGGLGVKTKWALIAGHALSAATLVALISYLVWSGIGLSTSDETLDNFPSKTAYRDGIIAGAVISITLSLANLGLWRWCMAQPQETSADMRALL